MPPFKKKAKKTKTRYEQLNALIAIAGRMEKSIKNIEKHLVAQMEINLVGSAQILKALGKCGAPYASICRTPLSTCSTHDQP